MEAVKIRRELGWQPARTFDEALRETIEWYLASKTWLNRVRSGEYVKYYERMYAGR
ncbi:MAG: dTDP-glucose 4,6-dehydratase [Verrucomicrobia bacterium ADurb.Bin345]|nr:MAG: dTDP-glucose 4,6-dehydratase [Verrucomicrobia bacterium ADurb.Bin345]